jgi:hypothetical protein
MATISQCHSGGTVFLMADRGIPSRLTEPTSLDGGDGGAIRWRSPSWSAAAATTLFMALAATPCDHGGSRTTFYAVNNDLGINLDGGTGDIFSLSGRRGNNRSRRWRWQRRAFGGDFGAPAFCATAMMYFRKSVRLRSMAAAALF